tara:strand:- start:80 stop:394 length:315 start_codon:yes stop_codon:yes gene_type:complete
MEIVESLCGQYPENFKKLDIASDPNFVFQNEQNFNTKQLFDSEGGTVFVNSFIECEHYVTGGWDYTPIKSLELLMHNRLFFGVLGLIFISFLNKKFNIFKNDKI